jgi:hypothetical protein
MADEHFVQCDQCLAVVERRLDHRPLLEAGGLGRDCLEDPGEVPRGVAHERACVAPRLGIDADDRLPVEILGDVGDEAVLTHGDDDIVPG